MKNFNITYVVLIVLILLSYFFAEQSLGWFAIAIALFAIVKFLLVGFNFMEVKHANTTWKVVLIFFTVVYFVATFV